MGSEMCIRDRFRSGGWFWFDTILSTRNHHFLIRTAVLSVAKELVYCFLLLLLVALAVWIGWSRSLWSILRFPAIYFIVSFLLMFLRGKAGADSNYFLEWEAALCLCAGVSYGFVGTQQHVPAIARLALPTLLASFVLISVGWVTLNRLLPFYTSVSDCGQAYRYVKAHPGDQILSENVGAAVLAGKPPGVLLSLIHI